MSSLTDIWLHLHLPREETHTKSVDSLKGCCAHRGPLAQCPTASKSPPNAAGCACRVPGPLESPAVAADEIPSQESHNHMVPMQTSWPLGGNTRWALVPPGEHGDSQGTNPYCLRQTQTDPHISRSKTYLTLLTQLKRPQHQPLQLQKRNLGASSGSLCVSSLKRHASDSACFFCFRGQKQCLFSRQPAQLFFLF